MQLDNGIYVPVFQVILFFLGGGFESHYKGKQNAPSISNYILFSLKHLGHLFYFHKINYYQF